MIRINLLLFFYWVSLAILYAQTNYTDFIGAGHNKGMTISSSHNKDNHHQASKSFDGFPVSNSDQLYSASRFLSQTSLGADYETIQMTAAMGFEAWLEEQFALPLHSINDGFESILNSDLYQLIKDEEAEGEIDYLFFRSAWWQTTMRSPDLLRQRLALALSEIFVISDKSDLFMEFGQALISYYDMLEKNSFGNYRDLLKDVTLHPAMGIYLSHFNNPKSDPSRNIHPDENYAREVMQLFSIGLYLLNPDGSCLTDDEGRCINSYSNEDIREFAKIFTGLGDGTNEGNFGEINEDHIDEVLTTPMRMYEEWHEAGEKKLLNATVVPSGQSGVQDLEQAIDNLYQHPNVGPFIGKSIIQFLITSNPSPAYISRVTSAFNLGEDGTRGDLKALLKAILLDPEARDCQPLNNAIGGKLREPIIRYTQFCKAFNISPSVDAFVNIGFRFQEATQQLPLSAPSVFNFFLPDYQPNGAIADANLVAPEFQIHNSSTAIAYINEVAEWVEGNSLMPFFGENEPVAYLHLEDEIFLAETNPAALIERLNILLAAGQLSTKTKSVILNAITQLDEPEDRLDMALYLLMISPDYTFMK